MDMGVIAFAITARSPCRANCSSYSDEIVHENDCSDSQFLRDCQSVLAEMTEN